MEIRNPIETLIGANGTAKVAGLSLLDLDSMTVRELRRHGLTASQAGRVKAAFELGRQLLEAEACLNENAPLVSTPEDAYRYMRPRYVNERREHFDVLMMTNRNRLIRRHRVSTGSLTASVVHPREVFHPVIRESAASVIFTHNHPSGDPSPSREDVDITHRLRQVGEVLGVRVHDHVVCGHDRFVSFNREGLL
ncbi:MAG: DNA repair protein RadC [Deltaproteobacteria bacterium]|nr:DNA repair protein RadC [Deltaproteobacteria bacterium]